MTVSVELVPRDKNILCQELQELKDNKLPVNLINIPELLRFNMHSWEGASIAKSYSFDAMPHVRALDINLEYELPMKEYFIKNKLNKVLVITGDPPQDMSHKVYPTISTDIIRKFRDELPDIKIFAGIDQYRSSMRHELYHIRRKIQAGASGFFTQPFFDLRYIQIYAEMLEDINVYWGISPVLSERSVSYWETKNNVVFPKHFTPTMEWNINFARKVISLVKNYGGNIYIMPIKTDLKKYMSGIFS
ncbi:methylenetetrahydrofolate reductase [Pectinatus sottacetonis]|uniref:methylenetetrahydrofolate reductase n=1 Tax=Pectinatus sottacetonis TaxID=1002795 RepID=UPI0018C45123|nr:methylenetetrahydrofolate reductase [Pectinatus sottacetonis]